MSDERPYGPPYDAKHMNEAESVRETRATTLAARLQEAQQTGAVPCDDCEKQVPLWIAFRCYYCGFHFCPDCAEDHFGQSRAEYFSDG